MSTQKNTQDKITSTERPKQTPPAKLLIKTDIKIGKKQDKKKN